MVKDSFFSGLRIILPIVLFIIIIGWIVGTLFDWMEYVEMLFPKTLLEATGLPDVIIKLLGLILICMIIWIIGIISKQPQMSKKFEAWLIPIVHKIPLLGNLFKITNQMNSTWKNTESFRKVVLVKCNEGGWEVGFLTGEDPEPFCKALDEDHLISVCIPFSPLTSSRIKLAKPEDVIETNVPVSMALSYILSMGAAGVTKKS